MEGFTACLNKVLPIHVGYRQWVSFYSVSVINTTYQDFASSLKRNDNSKPSDIWFASSKTNDFGASKKVRLFASLTDPEAEGTGIYFSPLDDKTLM